MIQSASNLPETAFCTVCQRRPDTIIVGSEPTDPLKQKVIVMCHGERWVSYSPWLMSGKIRIIVPPVAQDLVAI